MRVFGMDDMRIRKLNEGSSHIKGKCVDCKVVLYFKKEKGIKLEHRRCICCGERVSQTSHLIKGYIHYEVSATDPRGK